jgi:type I restriction enzyme M protein
MLNKELSTKVLNLWNLFRSAGSTNALSSLEQITYLIALKRLEAINQSSAGKRGAKGKAVPKTYPRWSEFIKLKSQQEKFDWFKNNGLPYLKGLTLFGDAFRLSMVDAVFGISKPKLLDDAINIMDALPFGDKDVDLQGDIYEELLSQLSFAGKHGQFLTPRHIIQTIVELCDPQPGERICDPAAGTAAFLVSAYQWMRKAQGSKGDLNPKDYVGYDFDTTIVRLGLMNMMLHGISQPEYYHQDSLSGTRLKPRQFDLVMSSPPFGGTVDRRTINNKLLSLRTQKIELLFVELSLALLKAKGRCAIIVPEAVAFATDSPSRTLRRQIIDNHKLEAVVSLPRGCFLPYTGSKTCILLVEKGGVTHQVLFYEVTGDGFTLNEKRSPDPENNDLVLVPQAYRALVHGDEKAWESTTARDRALQRSVLVSKSEIKANGLSFSIQLYRRLQSAAVVQETPRQIIEHVHTLQKQIRLKLKQIEAMIQEVTGA